MFSYDQHEMVNIFIYNIEAKAREIKIMNDKKGKDPRLYVCGRNNEYVYFGTSGRLYERITMHRKKKMKFNWWKSIGIKNTLERAMNELYFQLVFVPEYNIYEICDKIKINAKVKPNAHYFNSPKPIIGKNIRIQIPVFEKFKAIPRDKIKKRINKDKPIIYELWDKLSDKKPLYIGCSVKPLDRLLNHEINYNYVKKTEAYPEAFKRLMAELYLIMKKNPLCNEEPSFYKRQETE